MNVTFTTTMKNVRREKVIECYSNCNNNYVKIIQLPTKYHKHQDMFRNKCVFIAFITRIILLLNNVTIVGGKFYFYIKPGFKNKTFSHITSRKSLAVTT